MRFDGEEAVSPKALRMGAQLLKETPEAKPSTAKN